MNRTEILQQKSTTHVAATVDNHVAAPFRTEGGWQGECQCGQTSPTDTTLELADQWIRQHKRQMRQSA